MKIKKWIRDMMNEKYVNMPLWEKAIYAGLMAGTMLLVGRALYNRVAPPRHPVQPSAIEEILEEPKEEEEKAPNDAPDNPNSVPNNTPTSQEYNPESDYTIEDFSRELDETNKLLEKKLQEADEFMDEIDKIRELLREEGGSYPAPSAPQLAPPSQKYDPKYKPGNRPSPTKPAPKIRYRRFSPRKQTC